MATKKGKTIAVVVSLVVIAGVVGFVLYRRRKAKKAAAAQQAIPSTPTPSVSTSSPKPPTFTFPFKTEAEGNRFRQWVNDRYPDYARSIKLDRTGKLNSYVQTAWNKYGFEYMNVTAGGSASGKPATPYGSIRP